MFLRWEDERAYIGRGALALDIGRQCPCDGRQNTRNAMHNFPGEVSMLVGKGIRALGWMIAAVAALGMAVSPPAQDKKNKNGVILHPAGPPAGGGAAPPDVRAQIHLDHINTTPAEADQVAAAY